MNDEDTITELLQPFRCTIIKGQLSEFITNPHWIIEILSPIGCRYQFHIDHSDSYDKLSYFKFNILRHKKKAIKGMIDHLHHLDQLITA